MLSEDELKQIAQLMAEQLKPIKKEMNERFDKIEERLDIIEESLEETRGTTNALSEWVETNFSHKYPYPIEKVNI